MKPYRFVAPTTGQKAGSAVSCPRVLTGTPHNATSARNGLQHVILAALLSAGGVCPWVSATAWANTHTASNFQELQQAIQDANADTQSPVVIQLASDITIPASAVLNDVPRDLGFDAHCHDLSGSSATAPGGSGDSITLPAAAGVTLTIQGGIHGGDGASGAGGDGGDGGAGGDAGDYGTGDSAGG